MGVVDDSPAVRGPIVAPPQSGKRRAAVLVVVVVVVASVAAALVSGVVGYDWTHRYSHAELDRVAAKINDSSSACMFQPRAHVDLKANRVIIDFVAPSDAKLTGDEQAMVQGAPLPALVGCTIGT